MGSTSPAPYLWKNYQTRQGPTPKSWMGSLILGSRDESGQMYRRNRYYDPNTGRFTQEDPIGIAGGLNVYGFANGDPVSYSDPYGLCPCLALPLLGGATVTELFVGSAAIVGAQTLLLANRDKVSAAWSQATASVSNAWDAGVSWARSASSEDSGAGGGQSDAEQQRSIRSLERRLEEHQGKLDDYRRNPDAFDNKGHLKNAANEQVRQRIIEGRIRHLETEIRTFQRQIDQLRQ